MHLQEGKLVFIFPGDWKVSQYDSWSFYQNRFKDCCSGCKAVDFVALSSTDPKGLWLVEVKDYRRHPRTKAIDLPAEIALKVRDSLAGIAAAKFQADDSEENLLAKKALQMRKIRVVLHLEQPKRHSKLFFFAMCQTESLNQEQLRSDLENLKIEFDQCGYFSSNVDTKSSVEYRFDRIERFAKELGC